MKPSSSDHSNGARSRISLEPDGRIGVDSAMLAVTDEDDAPPLLGDGAALFLDFDGTLVEIAETPDAIRVPVALPRLLARLAQRLQGRVALVSGRSIADLERHLGPSSIAVSGSHGLELRLPDGTDLPLAVPPGMAVARDRVAAFAEAKGLLVEDKPASVAVHYRLRPERAGEVERFLDDLAGEHGLEVQRGKMVAELRPGGADKGDALRHLMSEPLFASARPLFVGDDLTDEDGFAAAAALGGGGILVGPSRPSRARWRLSDVAAVTRWLEASLAESADG
jgi:trehalose 6-phosphate phosphatase